MRKAKVKPKRGYAILMDGQMFTGGLQDRYWITGTKQRALEACGGLPVIPVRIVPEYQPRRTRLYLREQWQTPQTWLDGIKPSALMGLDVFSMIALHLPLRGDKR